MLKYQEITILVITWEWLVLMAIYDNKPTFVGR